MDTATCHADLERALDEFRQLRTRFELILEAAGEGIYGLDAQGRITFGNAATQAILGWKPAEAIGKRSHDIHHHSHADGSPYPRSECPHRRFAGDRRSARCPRRQIGRPRGPCAQYRPGGRPWSHCS